MPDILSQSEIDALLENSEKKGGRGRPGMSTYDFRHPARVNRQQLRTMENLHDNFARLLSHNLTGMMGAVVDADTVFIDQTTYAEFIMSLSNPSCSYQFTIGPHGGQAVVDIAMPVVFGYIDRRFGGKGASHGIDARQLHPTEMGELVPLVKQIIVDLEATWRPVEARMEISEIELETNPEFMQISQPHEIVILIAFEINSTNMSGLVSVCYPYFTIAPLIERFGEPGGVRRGDDATAAEMAANEARLASAAVDLRVELGRARLTAQQAQGLRAGDVLLTGQHVDRPVPVAIAGEPKLEGLPFAEGGRRKVRVTGPISPANEAATRQ